MDSRLDYFRAGEAGERDPFTTIVWSVVGMLALRWVGYSCLDFD